MRRPGRRACRRIHICAQAPCRGQRDQRGGCGSRAAAGREREPPPLAIRIAGRPPGVRQIAVVIVYVVVTAIMTWPFVNYGDVSGSSYGGDQRLIIWTLAWDNHAL